MPKFNADSAAGMLDDLKSRLGFGHKDEGYDDYDEFEDGYDDDYDYDGGNESAPVGGFRPVVATRTSHAGRFGRGDSAANNLVSLEDVKAHTRVPERLQRDPLADADDHYPVTKRSSYQPSETVLQARSEGYDSLFDPSETPTFTPYDPYEAYSSSDPSTYATARSLTVIKPVMYGDVERVARAVKSGDVVVLVMRNTPDDLSKRILDFSFGVASALDANVECPGDKVFAIARGNALTEGEKARLVNQGAL